VAAQLGADLASAGASVVSGLALGIDGAAHEGAIGGQRAAGVRGGPPVAVVAGGLDRPYPARHASLWRRVAESGVVISTSPARAPLDRGRFPQRNRIIAALSHVVVVVESHHAGGSLYTAREAERRGLLVGAVPGSIRSPSSAGTNDLLADGCFPVRDVTDVQAALGLMLASAQGVAGVRPAVPTPVGAAEATRAENVPSVTGRVVKRSAGGARTGERHGADTAPRDPVQAGVEVRAGEQSGDQPAELVLAAIGAGRCSIDQLLRRTGLDLPQLCTVLEQLRAEARLVEEGGWWENS
jgi:DNA protecting protein DprA